MWSFSSRNAQKLDNLSGLFNRQTLLELFFGFLIELELRVSEAIVVGILFLLFFEVGVAMLVIFADFIFHPEVYFVEVLA